LVNPISASPAELMVDVNTGWKNFCDDDLVSMATIRTVSEET
jgi:hypothetical protein